MAENQLPVLTLDFSDEKIKRLEEIAEKFKAGFAVGPGGFPVAEQKAIPGNNSQPQRIKETESTFDKFMKSLDKEGKATLKTFTLINKTLKTTTSTLKGLFKTTISWGTKLAALAVGGPFGYDVMARHITSQLLNAQGLNMTFGQTQTAASVYGTRFSATGSIEQMLATAQANPNSEAYQAVNALGLDARLGAGENLPKFFAKVDEIRKQSGGNALAMLQSMKVPLGSGDLNQIAANSDNLKSLQKQYQEQSAARDREINSGVLVGFQNVDSNLLTNAQGIYNTFLAAVSRLNPAIIKLSDALTDDIKGFLGGPNGKRLFTDISDGLTELGNWLKSDQFQQDLTDFEKAIKELVSAVGDAARWILKLTGKEDAKKDDKGNFVFDSKADALFALNSKDPKKQAAARDYLNKNSYFLKKDPLTASVESSNDGINSNSGVREWPSWANWLHGGRQGRLLLPARGIRNNNPGNLNFAGQEGASLEDGPNGRFAVFPTMISGIAALDKQLSLYMKRGKDTIDSIVKTYAPGSDHNNVAEYERYLSEVMHIGINQKIDPTSGSQMLSLMRGIIGMENGQQGNLISSSDILAAMAMNRGQPLPPGAGRQEPVRIEIVQTPGSDIAANVKGVNQYPG
ncbi:hypothetical protein FO131_19570 [Salmonella bongori]|uniref:hypothetical protein n=1 Tax=Salmonella bongori TaxID=54736 RepID=UPI00126AF698|nr:hypothetical protein [Salmonella bongori]ECG8260377.1 hypothetical protein [Salmonella bongori serovar 48:i:-]ECG9254707.1 hypothetical protein [Salmonella bongori]EDP8708173.1 hypothetical protein [Salmonella bongori]EDP8725793.1 hypothetical protein [Salmonella bongori]EEO9371549.1 hypothetical protein [Salmonella bongori]